MTGVFSPEAASCRCNSIPEIPPSCTSSNRQSKGRCWESAEKCFRGSICHRAHSRCAQQPAQRTAKTFVVIDDSNRERSRSLFTRIRKARLTPNCLSDYCPLGKVPASCQPSKFRNRLHAKLPRDARAVQLHHTFTDPKIVSDLLVQRAAQNLFEHLALPTA